MGRLDRIIYAIIAERRASGEDRGDLLSMLLHAQDEDDGRRMTDRQLRDEAMTLFMAGHETTANTLAWTWMLLVAEPRGRGEAARRARHRPRRPRAHLRRPAAPGLRRPGHHRGASRLPDRLAPRPRGGRALHDRRRARSRSASPSG